MTSTLWRLAGVTAMAGGAWLALALGADDTAHADDTPAPATAVLDLPDEAADRAEDVVDVVVPKDPPPRDEPEPEPAKDEPKPEKPDEPEKPRDDEPKPDKPADEPKPRDEEPAQVETPDEPKPETPTEPTPPADPIVDLPPVEVPPVVIDTPAPDPVVVEPVPVVIEVPPAAPTPAPVVEPAPVVVPAPSKPAPPADEAPEPPVATPVVPDPAPTPAPVVAPAPVAPLPVLIGPVPATGITLDGTPTVAVDDVPAAAAVLEVPVCADEQPAPARDYPRGNVRRILDTATGQPVTTVPADPPAKPCPSKPKGPDATTGISPTMKPGPPGIDLAVPSGSKLHHPTPALLRHIWPRAWIPATRGEHIEPRPA